MKKIIRNFVIPTMCAFVSTTALADDNVVQPTTAKKETPAMVAQQEAVTADKLTVTSAWARRSMAGNANSAAYISIHNGNNKDVEIIGITGLEVANRIELHTTANDDKGVSRMVSVDRLVIPAGGDLKMVMGGIHIMLLDLKTALNLGDKITLELKFKDLGPYPVEVEIKEAIRQ